MVQRDNSTCCVLLSLMFIVYLHEGASMIICPDVAELQSHALLSCPIPGSQPVIYYAPDNRTAATCLSVSPSCIIGNQFQRFNGTVVNETHSYLEISDVQLSDEGSWKCEDQNKDITTHCTLELIKTPTCHITSGNDTNNLDIHENISLSVNVTKYYCYSSIDVLLRAGNTEEDLLKNNVMKEKTITSDVFNSTFNVTESHIGSMELIFICNDVRKTVQCGGVQTLKKRPPMCNITADGDTGGWEVGDEITMYVYIEDYSCSGDLDFFLLPGGDTDRLNVTGIYNETITFTVKVSHFGPVYLEMNCNDVSRILTCYGIQELSKRQHTTASTPLHQSDYETGLPLLEVASGVAGTLLFVSLCLLVIFLMRMKNTLCLSGNQYDEFQGRNVDARTGYDEIGIQRSQEMVTAEGGEYEMTGNQYYNLQGGNDDETHGYVEVDIPRSRVKVKAEDAEGEATEP